MKLNNEIISFFKEQGFNIVSTLNKDGSIHSSCKGIVDIKNNKAYLLDLYCGRTFKNIRNNPNITVTAVDEHAYKGYALSGEAKIVKKEDIGSEILKSWEKNISKRVSKRLVKNIKNDRKSKHHPEAKFPNPKYLILLNIEKVTDLAPVK